MAAAVAERYNDLVNIKGRNAEFHSFIHMYVCMYICMNTYMYVCMYVYITFTWIHMARKRNFAKLNEMILIII